MPDENQTSFIPKKTLSDEPIKRAPSKRVNVFSFIAIILFFGSLVAGGGVYFFKIQLEKSVQEMSNQLELARGAFEPELIEQIQILDTRLNAAQEILNNHVTVSPLFETLQDLTLQTIQFTGFEYKIGQNPSVVKVEMSGKARNYKSIALQSDLLDRNKNIKNQIFSNLTLDEKGNVSFDLSFDVDSAFLRFGRTIAEGVSDSVLTISN